MARDRIICGDWLAILKEMPAGLVQCVVSSPPYWGLRDYKVGGQLGLEKTPAEYVAKLVEGFREVRRVLRDDGTLWLNMGDSYCGIGGQGKQDGGPIGATAALGSARQKTCAGLKPKDLCGIPWRVAFALQADGWYLRCDIIWAKPNPMPESVTDRPTKAHEYLFLLTKKPRYFYDQEAIREPHLAASLKRDEAGWKAAFVGRHTDPREKRPHSDDHEGFCHPSGRNKRSVWTIPTQAYKEAHFATFPEKLVEPCILAGTSAKGCCPECGAPWKRIVEKSKRFESGSGRSGNPIGGKHGEKCQGGGDTGDIRKGPCLDTQTVGWEPTCNHHKARSAPCLCLDPFMGSGTVAVVAKRLGRDFIGIELNPDYAKLADKRLRESCPLLLEAGK